MLQSCADKQDPQFLWYAVFYTRPKAVSAISPGSPGTPKLGPPYILDDLDSCQEIRAGYQYVKTRLEKIHLSACHDKSE